MKPLIQGQGDTHFSRGRFRDPALGRFLQTDPIGYDADINLYAYVGNDPLGLADPTGENPAAGCAVGAGVGAAAGGVGAIPGCAIGAAITFVATLVCVAFCDDAVNAAGDAISNAMNSGDEEGDPSDDDVPASDRNVSRQDNGGPRDPRPVPPPITGVSDHGQERRDLAAAGDAHRQVGDPNRVVREGSAFTDTETGNTVYVNGGRAVVVRPDGTQASQFRITRANLQQRLQSGRYQRQ